MIFSYTFMSLCSKSISEPSLIKSFVHLGYYFICSSRELSTWKANSTSRVNVPDNTLAFTFA